MAAEFAADRSFNKAIVNGKRLKVSWGRSQEERSSGGKDDKDKNSKQYAPVPGLPGGKFFLKNIQKDLCSLFCVCHLLQAILIEKAPNLVYNDLTFIYEVAICHCSLA